MHLRDLTTLADFGQAVELEKRIWGYDDAEDVVPLPILAVTVKRGAILIGAFDDHDRMVGFVYSIPAVKARRLAQWSHMLGVLDEHRGSGLGRRLKLEQRRKALEMGVDVIEWTYDPLQSANASLNFNRLGVVVREYEENIYGESSSALHRGTPTDRFIAEWWIRSEPVERRIVEGMASPDLSGDPSITRTRGGEWLTCEGFDLSLDGPRLTVEIPPRFTDILTRRPTVALEWRHATRAIFNAYFARGYRVTGFSLDGSRGRYLLTPGGDVP